MKEVTQEATKVVSESQSPAAGYTGSHLAVADLAIATALMAAGHQPIGVIHDGWARALAFDVTARRTLVALHAARAVMARTLGEDVRGVREDGSTRGPRRKRALPVMKDHSIAAYVATVEADQEADQETAA